VVQSLSRIVRGSATASFRIARRQNKLFCPTWARALERWHHLCPLWLLGPFHPTILSSDRGNSKLSSLLTVTVLSSVTPRNHTSSHQQRVLPLSGRLTHPTSVVDPRNDSDFGRILGSVLVRHPNIFVTNTAHSYPTHLDAPHHWTK
jgi:hypothetical protein